MHLRKLLLKKQKNNTEFVFQAINELPIYRQLILDISGDKRNDRLWTV